MCTGLEIAGIATALAGTGASEYAGISEKNAMNSAANNELARQQQYNQQGQKAFQQSLQQSTPQAVQGQLNTGAEQAVKAYGALQQNQVPGQGLTAGMTQPNSGAVAAENSLIGGRTGQSNAAASKLQGYGNYNTQQYLGNLAANTQLGQIGNFARQSESVLTLELQQAQNSQSALAGIGSLGQTVGGLMGLFGSLSAPTAGVATGNQLAGLGAGYGPVSSGYANTLANGGMLTNQLSQNTLAGLGYGAPLSTFGGW